MERIIYSFILTLAIISTTLVVDAEGRAYPNDLTELGPLETRDDGLGPRTRSMPEYESGWAMGANPEEPTSGDQAYLTGEDLITRLLLELQAQSRASGTGNGISRPRLPLQGTSGSRYKKRQILYRQCFFNPISCF